jgi:hypothetical protein
MAAAVVSPGFAVVDFGFSGGWSLVAEPATV